jgi:hypothetical protein
MDIYKTINSPVVLYGCETWSLTLREGHRLSVFENRVLRTIFGSRRDEMTGDWRKLRNEELHNLYSSPDIIRMIKSRRIEMGGACSTNGGDKECMKDIGGKARKKETTRKTKVGGRY